MPWSVNGDTSSMEQETAERARFTEWCNQLMWHMTELTKQGFGGGGMMIDSAIPYRLGWSPERTARALLNYSRKDADELCRAVRGSDT